MRRLRQSLLLIVGRIAVHFSPRAFTPFECADLDFPSLEILDQTVFTILPPLR
jgi:hypothetical protein